MKAEPTIKVSEVIQLIDLRIRDLKLKYRHKVLTASQLQERCRPLLTLKKHVLLESRINSEVSK